MGDRQIWISNQAYQMLEAYAHKTNKMASDLATQIILDKLKEAQETKENG